MARIHAPMLGSVIAVLAACASQDPNALPPPAFAQHRLLASTASCVLEPDATLYCWGNHVLADADAGIDVQLRARLLATIPDATTLATGEPACALRSSGTLECWNVSTYWLPSGVEQPMEFPGVGDAIRVAFYRNYRSAICVLRAAGSIACLRDTTDYGTWPTELPPGESVVTTLQGVPEATDIAGGVHLCIRTRDGGVLCDESLYRYFSSELTPVFRRVEGLDAVDEIAVGGSHACAREGGHVLCWGDNSLGQIGDGVLTTPRVIASRVSGLDDAVEISAGQNHTCARRTSGRVVCWGDSSDGQLGDGVSATVQPTPVAVVGLDDAVEIAAGGNHTCARRVSGGVVCWGWNDQGQLGDGTRVPSRRPVAVLGLP